MNAAASAPEHAASLGVPGSAGSAPTQVILWIGLVLVAGIGLYWFVFHFSNAQYLFEVIDNDVLLISSRINQHCDDNHHFFRYNPKVEDGNLFFSKNEICIEARTIKKCAELSCGPEQYVEIDLAKITYVEGERGETLHVSGK